MVLIAEISWRSLWQRATRLTRLVAEMVVVRKEEKEERERGKEKDRWERNGRCRGGSETDRFVGRSSAWLVWITETIATSSLQRRRYVFAASNVPRVV